MKRIITILSTFYILLFTVTAQQIEWKKSYGWEFPEEITSINYINNKIYSSGKSTFGTASNIPIFLCKKNTNGDTLLFKEEGSFESWIFDGAVINSHQMYFLGRRFESPNYTSTLVTKVDTNGNFIWTKEYNTNTTANVRSIVALPDGGAVHIGERGDFSTMVNFYAIRIDCAG